MKAFQYTYEVEAERSRAERRSESKAIAIIGLAAVGLLILAAGLGTCAGCDLDNRVWLAQAGIPTWALQKTTSDDLDWDDQDHGSECPTPCWSQSSGQTVWKRAE